MLIARKQKTLALNAVYPWIIILCGMCFYCYNYFLRVSPSVMQPELSRAFHINAYQFGSLAAFYYYAYTLMQIPAGVLYDKFGVRFVLTGACLMATLGVSVFISADNFYIAGIGRFMIGVGSAFAYIGTLKLASIWLPPHRFATIAGSTTAIGMIAGALAQKYLADIVAAIGYQQALETSLVAGILLAFCLFMIVRNKPANTIYLHDEPKLSSYGVFQSLKLVLSNPQMWLIGAIGGLLYLPSSVFLDLWGIPYLKTVYQLTSQQAIAIASYTFCGWIISGPLVGFISDKIKKRRLPILTVGMFAPLILCIVFYLPGLTLTEINACFFFVGFCCGVQSLCFAMGKENNPPELAATAVAVTNMLIMIGGAIFQPLVGKLLDLHTTSPLIDGLPSYSGDDFTFALSVIPIGVALGIFLSLFLKESYQSKIKI